MRIVHVQDYYQPMLGYQEVFLPRAQAKLGHEVFMVTSDRYKPMLFRDNKDLLQKRIINPGFYSDKGVGIWRLKTALETPHDIYLLNLCSKVKELKPDVVTVHGIVNSSSIRVARLKNKQPGFKLIYDDHMTYTLSTSKSRILYPLLKKTALPFIKKAADFMVAVGYPSKVFMHETYGIPLDQIAIIPLGADHEIFKFEEAARKEQRKRLNIKEKDVVYIYSGKITRIKKLELLIKAVNLLKEHEEIKVLIAGNGDRNYIIHLKEMIRNSGLEEIFIWHEFVPNKELHKLYSASDVAVWTGGPSISMIEAMACKLPIITSSNPNINEMTYVNDQLKFQSENEHMLAKQMEKLLNVELRREKGDSGRQLVLDKLNWDVIAKQFIELAQ